MQSAVSSEALANYKKMGGRRLGSGHDSQCSSLVFEFRGYNSPYSLSLLAVRSIGVPGHPSKSRRRASKRSGVAGLGRGPAGQPGVSGLAARHRKGAGGPKSGSEARCSRAGKRSTFTPSASCTCARDPVRSFHSATTRSKAFCITRPPEHGRVKLLDIRRTSVFASLV